MTKHIHYDTIMAWANGASIEMQDILTETWHDVDSPSWYGSIDYRVKPQPKPDIVHEAYLTLSPSAGPMLYALQRSIEANIVMVFDGETGKLKGCSFKQA